jgi:hypothetical protein
VKRVLTLLVRAVTPREDLWIKGRHIWNCVDICQTLRALRFLLVICFFAALVWQFWMFFCAFLDLAVRSGNGHFPSGLALRNASFYWPRLCKTLLSPFLPKASTSKRHKFEERLRAELPNILSNRHAMLGADHPAKMLLSRSRLRL